MALVAALGVELAIPMTKQPAPVSVPSPAAPAVTLPPSTDLTPHYVQTILARPLFNENRRPASVAAVQTAATPEEPVPRLSGIMVTANVRRAIFEVKDKPVAGGIGSPVGAYRIIAIAPSLVTLQGPAGIQTLSPSFNAGMREAAIPAKPSILEDFNSGKRVPTGMPTPLTTQQMMAKLPTSLH